MAVAAAWWRDSYPLFSLAALTALPAYQRLHDLQSPYSHTDERRTETCTRTEQEQEYVLTDTVDRTTVKLTQKGEEWMYERTYWDQETEVRAVTRMGRDREWGEVERRFLGQTSVEKWEKGEEGVKYEKRTENGDAVFTVSGGKDSLDSSFGWSEASYVSPSRCESERLLTSPFSQSGQTTHTYGPHSWGTTWRKLPHLSEQSYWRRNGDFEWKHTHGSTDCGKTWDDHCEITAGRRREDRLSHDNGRYCGFLLHRDGKNFLKGHWESDSPNQPELDIHKAEESADLRLAIEKAKANVLQSFATLKVMISTAPDLSSDLLPLSCDLDTAIADSEESFAKLLRLQDFQQTIEQFKRKVEDSRSEHVEKFEAIETPLKELAKGAVRTVGSSQHEEHEADFEAAIHNFTADMQAIEDRADDVPLIRIRNWIELLQKVCKFTCSRLPEASGASGISATSGIPGTSGTSGPSGDVSKLIKELWARQTHTLNYLGEMAPGPLDSEDMEKWLKLMIAREESLIGLIGALLKEKLRGKNEGGKHTQTESEAAYFSSDKTVPPRPSIASVSFSSTAIPGVNPLGNLHFRDFSQISSVSHPESLEAVEILESAAGEGVQDPTETLLGQSETVEKVNTGRSWDSVSRTLLALDKLLSKTLKETGLVLGEVNMPAELREETMQVAQKVVKKEGVDVLMEKARQLHKNVLAIKAGERSLADIVEELTLNNDELDQLLRQKSDEIVFLAKEMDRKDRKLRERQEELLMLRKYKATQDDNSSALKDMQIQLREFELSFRQEKSQDSIVLVDERKSHSLRYILSLLRKRRHINQAVVFAEWHGGTQPEGLKEEDLEGLTEVGDTKWPPAMEAEYLTEVDAKEVEKAELPLARERLAMVQQNEAIRGVKNLTFSFKYPLSDFEFYRFMESCFREKTQQDTSALVSGTRPPSFPVFLLYHCTTTVGSKEKGLQYLAQTALSLGNLYRERQSYAMFAARMMRICDPHPATLEGELLALKYWQRLSYARELPNDSLAQGGLLPLSVVLDTYYADFAPDPTVAQIWLSRIRPAALQEDQYGLYLLNWQLQHCGKQPEEAFGLLASPFQRSDFAAAIREQLDLHLPKAVFGGLWSLLRGKAAITLPKLKEELQKKVPEDTVTVANFLHGVLDAHETKRKRTARNLMRLLPSSLSKDAFRAFYRSQDSEAPEEWIIDLIEQLRENDPLQPFAVDNVIQILASHPPKALQTPVLHIDILHSILQTYSFSTSLDTFLQDTPVQRVRLIRTTETVLSTTRRLFKSRRRS